jgi:hypothetical protein
VASTKAFWLKAKQARLLRRGRRVPAPFQNLELPTQLSKSMLTDLVSGALSLCCEQSPRFRAITRCKSSVPWGSNKPLEMMELEM